MSQYQITRDTKLQNKIFLLYLRFSNKKIKDLFFLIIKFNLISNLARDISANN